MQYLIDCLEKTLKLESTNVAEYNIFNTVLHKGCLKSVKGYIFCNDNNWYYWLEDEIHPIKESSIKTFSKSVMMFRPVFHVGSWVFHPITSIWGQIVGCKIMSKGEKLYWINCPSNNNRKEYQFIAEERDIKNLSEFLCKI